MRKNYNWPNHLLNFLTVIVGVYLAFYIGERAKVSEGKKEGLLLMKSIVNDLSVDIKVYEDYQIPINIKCQENIDSLLSLLSTDKIVEINNQLPAVFQLENYSPTASTYNSMKFSGKIKLIDDLALQKKLNEFYDGIALECVEKNEMQAEFFMNELMKWLTFNADLMEMKLLDKNGLIILRNKVMIYKSLINQKVKNYEMIVEESKQLNRQLDSLIRIK